METIQIVLASPSDLSDERQMIKELINTNNPRYTRNDIYIDLRMWENVSPGMNANGPQGLIDTDLEIPKADIFICLFWQRIGTPINDEGITGTEHELNIALENYHQKRSPDIKVFFKKVTDSCVDTEDVKKIQAISKKLQNKGLYNSFSSLEELKDIIGRILSDEVMKRLKSRYSASDISRKYIEVTSSNQMIENLASNTKLVLHKGFLDVLDFENETEFARKEDVFDGKELIVQNVNNLTIIGDNTTLLTIPRYANVIHFISCSNIKIIGMTLGHTPYKGSCMGSVLKFDNCTDIQLDSLELFGCGTYGIDLEKCTNVCLNGIKIFECTYGAMNIISSDMQVDNSMIYDCNKIAGCLIEAYSSQLDFNNVSIFNNYIDNYLISLNESSLFCRGVSIYSNSYAALCNENIPFGISQEDNIITSSDTYLVTISSTKSVNQKVYNQYKELALNYGKISEMIYENGNFSISVSCIDYNRSSELCAFLDSDNNVITACG